MGAVYTQLSDAERCEIMVMKSQAYSMRSIGRVLCRSASTVSRELKRNCVSLGVYSAKHAQTQAILRCCGREKRLSSIPELKETVVSWLKKGWSPQQISGKIRRMKDERTGEHTVSHETIYAHIYAHPRGELRRDLIACLRRSHKNRRKRGAGKNRKNIIPDLISIHDRPADVENRAVSGHWEGDLIKGKANASAVATVVERKTRYLILAKVENATSPVVTQGFIREMRRVPDALLQTFTYDRGVEMTRHADLAQELNLSVFFADPYSPWQRGTNENTNGVVREYLPKGTDLSGYSQEELNAIADIINDRPRACLDFMTPKEAYMKDVADVQLKQ